MPTRRALLWTQPTGRISRWFSSSCAPLTLTRSRCLANRSGQGKDGSLEPEGVQVLLHSRSTKRHSGHCRRSTEDLLRLQQGLLDAVAPFTEKTGTAAAFVSAAEGRDIQQGLIEYVANFATVAAGKKLNPHVTIGVAPEAYLNEMLAEPVADIYLLARGRGGLSTRQFWRSPQGAPGLIADAMSAGRRGSRMFRSAEKLASIAARVGVSRPTRFPVVRTTACAKRLHARVSVSLRRSLRRLRNRCRHPRLG